MEPPVMSKALAQRIDAVLVNHSLESKQITQALPGNPLGVVIQTFGASTAHLAQAAGNGWWNRVSLVDNDPATIDQVIAFFRDHGVEPNIDLEPSRFTPDLSRHLSARGLYLASVDTVVYGTPSPHPPTPSPTWGEGEPDQNPSPGPSPHKGGEPSASFDFSPFPRREGGRGVRSAIVVREVGKNEVDLVTRLWADGFEFHGEGRDVGMLMRHGSFMCANNHLYVAYVDGEPAAMSALVIQDGIGYLNVGATLPQFRRLGLHNQMSQRRVQDALDADCELMIGYTAGFGKTSQNNMERKGLRVAYNRLSWTTIPV